MDVLRTKTKCTEVKHRFNRFQNKTSLPGLKILYQKKRTFEINEAKENNNNFTNNRRIKLPKTTTGNNTNQIANYHSDINK